MVGASGTTQGVTGIAVDGAEFPREFTALMTTEYVVPLVNPDTLMGIVVFPPLETNVFPLLVE